jgi:hypothetical protein
MSLKKYPVPEKVIRKPRGSTVTKSYPSTGYETFTWRPDMDADDPSQGSAALTKRHKPRKKVS